MGIPKVLIPPQRCATLKPSAVRIDEDDDDEEGVLKLNMDVAVVTHNPAHVATEPGRRTTLRFYAIFLGLAVGVCTYSFVWPARGPANVLGGWLMHGNQTGSVSAPIQAASTPAMQQPFTRDNETTAKSANSGFDLAVFVQQMSELPLYDPLDPPNLFPNFTAMAFRIYQPLAKTTKQRARLLHQLEQRFTNSLMVSATIGSDLSLTQKGREGTILELFDQYLQSIGMNGLWHVYADFALHSETPDLYSHHIFAAYCAIALMEQYGLSIISDVTQFAAWLFHDISRKQQDSPRIRHFFAEGWHVHGIMWGGMVFARKMIPDSGPQDISRFAEAVCSRADQESNFFQACVHGMGHGAYQTFGIPNRRPTGDIRSVIHTCSNMSDPFLGIKCATGIFHEAES